MSKSRNMADLLDSNGDVKSGALDNVVIPQVDDEIAIGATAPSSPTQGQVWYDTGLDILKAYDGTNWNKVSPVIPTISSISGNIYEGSSGNITITGTGFLSGNCDVEFSGSFTTTVVTALASSDTSLVVAVPAAAYASSGTVTVKVTNGDNGQSTSSTFSVVALPTGGTITTSGGYRYHKFTSSSTLVIPTGFTANVDALVLAGGGGGGSNQGGGGGGAGGYIAISSQAVTSGNYSITIGAGGAADSNGQNTSALSTTATGGGAGAYMITSGSKVVNGNSGGSGGGGSCWVGTSNIGYGVSGVSGQGNAGGQASAPTGNGHQGGGGGGANASGGAGFEGTGGDGGAGKQWLDGNYYAGGGGGGCYYNISGKKSGDGGIGGGGAGDMQEPGTHGTPGNPRTGAADNWSGSPNTGGGGGGAGYWVGNGGSGIVIIRYAL